MAELARQRVATAQTVTTVRRFECSAVSLVPPSPPRSSVEKSSGFRPHARPFEPGRGVHFTATSFNGRTTGCYPEDAGSTPAVAASRTGRRAPAGRSPAPRASRRRSARESSCPGRLARSRMPVSHTGDAGSNPARGTSRSRTRLGMRPGCLPGEAGSTPVESAPRRSSADEHHAPTVAHGGSTPPGETASQG